MRRKSFQSFFGGWGEQQNNRKPQKGYWRVTGTRRRTHREALEASSWWHCKTEWAWVFIHHPPTHFPPHNPLDSPTFPQFRCGGVKYLHLNCALSKIYAHLFVRLQRISSSRSRLKWKSMRRCLHVHGEIISHLNMAFNNHLSHVKSSLNNIWNIYELLPYTH